MLARRFALLVGIAALGAVGCKDFTYYDVDVKLDAATFNGTYGSIQACHMYVTGAESHDFVINDNRASCPPNGLEMGVYEYSSLADSGQLTFTMKLYNKVTELESCQIGQGSVTATLPAAMTTNMITLTVGKGGSGPCP